MTPAGQAKVRKQMTGLDLVALVAESAHENAPVLGRDDIHVATQQTVAEPGR